MPRAMTINMIRNIAYVIGVVLSNFIHTCNYEMKQGTYSSLIATSASIHGEELFSTKTLTAIIIEIFES